MDLARKDMERVGAKEGDEVDRVKWKILSRCGDPEWGEAERRRRCNSTMTPCSIQAYLKKRLSNSDLEPVINCTNLIIT